MALTHAHARHRLDQVNAALAALDFCARHPRHADAVHAFRREIAIRPHRYLPLSILKARAYLAEHYVGF